MRQVRKYQVHDVKSFLRSLLFYGNTTETFCLLNSNHSANLPHDKYSSYDLLAGIGSIEELNVQNNSFDSLQKFQNKNRDWLFGFFGYDLKNETNKLSSSNFDALNFPTVHFFRPRYVVALDENHCEIYFDTECDSESSA